jgi:hypothetical protein
MALPRTALALVVCVALAVPSVAADSAVSGTLLVDGSPASGMVMLTQYNGTVLVHDDHVQVGPDGRFTFNVGRAQTTNLAASAGGFDSGVSLRVRDDLDFPWRVDRTTGPMAPVQVLVRDGATDAPVTSDLLIMDAVTIAHHCVKQPGEMQAATGTAPPISGSPTSSPPPMQPRDCALTWEEAGQATGQLPQGIYVVQVHDPDWTSCNWEWRESDECRPYLPVHASLAVHADGAALNLTLLRARPADAWLEGYLLSELKPGPLPRKPIYISDGDTSVAVTMDEDGSYRIALPSGTYTLAADLCGHQGAVQTILLEPGATRRQDLTLTAQGTGSPGTGGSDGTVSWGPVAQTAGSSQTGADPAYPACDHTPTPTFTGSPQDAGEDGGEGEDRVGHALPSSSLLVIDFGGGLGPLGGATAKDDEDLTSAGSKGSPALGPLALLLALALLAVAVRRRL